MLRCYTLDLIPAPQFSSWVGWALVILESILSDSSEERETRGRILSFWTLILVLRVQCAILHPVPSDADCAGPLLLSFPDISGVSSSDFFSWFKFLPLFFRTQPSWYLLHKPPSSLIIFHWRACSSSAGSNELIVSSHLPSALHDCYSAICAVGF